MALPAGLPSNIFKIRSLLEILAFEAPALGRSLLRVITGEVHRALRELSLNLLSGCLPLQTPEDKLYFKRQKPLLRLIANPRTSLTTVQRRLKQKGCLEPIRRLARLALEYFKDRDEHKSRKVQPCSSRSSSKGVKFVESRSPAQRQRATTPANTAESDSESSGLPG